MLTVKEFKDLGGNMFVGDEISIGTMKSLWGSGDANYYALSPQSYDDVIIDSFALRPIKDLPEDPKFKYEKVRVPFSGGKTMWRPLLDQSQTETPEESEAFNKMKPYEFDDHVSEAEPVFTQGMADAGELPPVGSKFLHNGEVVLCISTTSHDGGVVTFRRLTQGNGPDIACCWNNKSWVKPLDTRTPKQKAVDAALNAIGKSELMVGMGIKRVIGDLYDAGLLKC